MIIGKIIRAVHYFCKTLQFNIAVRQDSAYTLGSEYARVLKKTGSEYASGSEYTRDLNMRQVLNIPEFLLYPRNEYASGSEYTRF